MKKSLSILLTLLTLISIAYGSTFSVFAETTTKYWEPRPNFQDSMACINDEPGGEILNEYNAEFNTHTYYYYGSGNFIRWEFPTLTEGKDNCALIILNIQHLVSAYERFCHLYRDGMN